MKRSEAYLDIVWRQFKKNLPALVAFSLLAPLFLTAIFAPLIASNQPLVFRDGQETLYPWFHALFNTEEEVDFAFNMAMVGFFPWVLLALVLNRLWRRRDVPGRRRVLRAGGLYLVIIAVLVGVFSFENLCPDNRYYTRTFPEEEFNQPDAKKGWYALIPFGPREQNTGRAGDPGSGASFQPPLYRKSPEQSYKINDRFPHVLGTDNLGRDVLVQMIYGTRIALTVGFVAVAIYIPVGVVLGALAGYFGGKVDLLISRVIEVIMLFPAFFLILTLVALIGPSIYIIMVVIGLTGWPGIARLIRGEVLKQRSIDYVAAARALGSSHMRIVFRHILPNAISPALVSAPFGIAGAIITEAGLSLLGFGVRPPTPSWGTLLRLGNENYTYWWLVVIPSLAMFFTVTIFNLVGSGLRDAMDPRLRM